MKPLKRILGIVMLLLAMCITCYVAFTYWETILTSAAILGGLTCMGVLGDRLLTSD